jgi:hypothetical protein
MVLPPNLSSEGCPSQFVWHDVGLFGSSGYVVRLKFKDYD